MDSKTNCFFEKTSPQALTKLRSLLTIVEFKVFVSLSKTKADIVLDTASTITHFNISAGCCRSEIRLRTIHRVSLNIIFKMYGVYYFIFKQRIVNSPHPKEVYFLVISR